MITPSFTLFHYSAMNHQLIQTRLSMPFKVNKSWNVFLLSEFSAPVNQTISMMSKVILMDIQTLFGCSVSIVFNCIL